jgi:hypothetical protein
MALVNFENSNINVIPAKHLYIIDKDGNQQEVKYVKDRNWWNFIFSENVNITALDEVEKSDIRTKLPHNYIDFFDKNKIYFQAKAIYFIDANGDAIEFLNEIKKDWVNEYVTSDVFTPDFKPDIPLNLSEDLITTTDDSVSDETSHIMYPDIPINNVEDLVCTVNNPFGIEAIDISIIPLFISNIAIEVIEVLDSTVNNPIDSDTVSITLTPI